MKFIAYILIAANVALGAFYFSTQTKKDSPVQLDLSATLSNLSTTGQPVVIESPPVKTNTTQNAAIKPPETEKPVTITPPPVIEQPKVCLEISQIIEESTSFGIQTMLIENQIEFTTSEQEVLIRTVYSILLGPFASDNRTKLEIKNLQNDKIDYYVLPDNPNKGAISLGLYSNKSGAEGEVKKFIAKDYDARLEEKDIYKTQYLINIPAQSSDKLTDELWNTILKSFSAIKKSKISC